MITDGTGGSRDTSKGLRRKKLTIEVSLKVYDWLLTYATSTTQTVPSVIRGALQDFIDDVDGGVPDDWWENYKREKRK